MLQMNIADRYYMVQFGSIVLDIIKQKSRSQSQIAEILGEKIILGINNSGYWAFHSLRMLQSNNLATYDTHDNTWSAPGNSMWSEPVRYRETAQTLFKKIWYEIIETLNHNTPYASELYRMIGIEYGETHKNIHAQNLMDTMCKLGVLSKYNRGKYVHYTVTNMNIAMPAVPLCLKKDGLSSNERYFRQMLIDNNYVYYREVTLGSLYKRNPKFTEFKKHNVPPNLKGKRWDYLIDFNDQLYFVELDGGQHFKRVNMWDATTEKFIEKQNCDIVKTLGPRKFGIKMIRIHYKDMSQCLFHLRSAISEAKIVYYSSPAEYKYITDNDPLWIC